MGCGHSKIEKDPSSKARAASSTSDAQPKAATLVADANTNKPQPQSRIPRSVNNKSGNTATRTRSQRAPHAAAPETPQRAPTTGSVSGSGRGSLRKSNGNDGGGGSPRSLRRVRSRENLHSRIGSINYGGNGAGEARRAGTGNTPNSRRNSYIAIPASKMPTRSQSQHRSPKTEAPILGAPFEPESSPKGGPGGDTLIVTKLRSRSKRRSSISKSDTAIPMANRRDSNVLTGLDLNLVGDQAGDSLARRKSTSKRLYGSEIKLGSASKVTLGGIAGERPIEHVVLVVKDPDVESKTKIPRPVKTYHVPEMRRKYVRISRSCENLSGHGRNTSVSLNSNYTYTSTDASTPDPDPEQAKAETEVINRKVRVEMKRPVRRATEGSRVMMQELQRGNGARSVSQGSSKLPRMRGRQVSRTQGLPERPKTMVALEVGMGVAA